MGIQASIEKVEDIQKIMGYGVMRTPAIVVNGQVKAFGRVPGKDEIKQYIKDAQEVLPKRGSVKMVNKNNTQAESSCYSCGTGCCDAPKNTEAKKRSITIDFLYLDLSVCTRCQGTDTSLDEALEEVLKVLKETGIEVLVNKINVNTEELAIKHRFISSPTIRVNGKDIQMEIKENLCESCGDLCGDEVDCRVWVYQGKDYTAPPKGMIMEAILREVYGGGNTSNPNEKPYQIPENLKKFFTGIGESVK